MDNIQNEIELIKNFVMKQNILQKEFLTLEELTFYLGLSRSSIYKLTSKREIPFYSPGGKKLYFKRTEIDAWIYKSKITPIFEIELEIDEYLNRNIKAI